MPSFKVVEELRSRPDPALSDVLQSLADAFLRISPRCDVEQALISFGVLHDGCRFPVHRKDHWALALFKLFQKFAGAAAESCQRLDIFVMFSIVPSPIKAPF
jgi:hypothetical protein